jgi:glycosyltransferase involved in cell wall biosynthesis
MRLAVLMATYNGEKYLEEQIESILSQKTKFEFDLIIRDDGSKDGTREILKKYGQEGKIIFIEGNNIGAAKGFISMLKQAVGYDYYAFSDQDDVWNENKLQNGVDAIKEVDGPALYCSNCELVDAELNSIGRNTHRSRPSYTLESILCLASCAQGCTSVFNKELARIIQENEVPDVFIMHDSLVTCLCGLIGGTIIYDEEPSMKYRMHGNNVFGMVSARQNLGNVVKDRLSEITQKREISMYDQADSLLRTYKAYIPEGNQRLCKVVIDAKKSLLARLRLVLSKNLRHDTLNKTITKKLEILFGND